MNYKDICMYILHKINMIVYENKIPDCVILGEKYFNILNKEFKKTLKANITEIYGLKIIVDKENKERISVGI